jgi:hypothetical protein
MNEYPHLVKRLEELHQRTSRRHAVAFLFGFQGWEAWVYMAGDPHQKPTRTGGSHDPVLRVLGDSIHSTLQALDWLCKETSQKQ